MSLASDLNAFKAERFHSQMSATHQTIQRTMSEFEQSFDLNVAVKVGDKLPEHLVLYDANGKPVDRNTLRAFSSPAFQPSALLIHFFRGGWCPFCNIALRAYARRAAEFRSRNVLMLFVSPELPTQIAETEAKAGFHDLREQQSEGTLHVLSDPDNALARQLGIVWKQPDEMRPVFDKLGCDIQTRNGNQKLEVPVPTTMLVDGDNVVRNIHLDPNFMKRLEPDTALEWIDALSAQ